MILSVEGFENNNVLTDEKAKVLISKPIMSKEEWQDRFCISSGAISNSNTITTDSISGDFSEDTYERIFEEMAKRFNKVPITEHKCRNCGGTVEMNVDKHIFVCPYCGSAYAIGTNQINDF